jgi:hypothetical protein
MDFHSLKDGCVVRGRCGRAGRDDVEWEPVREHTLFVQKDARGCTCLIAICGKAFAEFDPRHDQEGEHLLLSEDYYFEVTEVVSDAQ